jgi:post-segregation antitoxin (ccd killing protein)
VVAEQVRSQARRWVEENFDAHRNAARLLEAFEQGVAEKSV